MLLEYYETEQKRETNLESLQTGATLDQNSGDGREELHYNYWDMKSMKDRNLKNVRIWSLQNCMLYGAMHGDKILLCNS